MITTIVGVLMLLVVGFCCGKLIASDTDDVRRLNKALAASKAEADQYHEELEHAKAEIHSLKYKLGGIGNAITKLSE